MSIVNRSSLIRGLLLAAWLFSGIVGAVCVVRADEPDYGAELPRIPPLAPRDALNSFQFGRDGFEIEQVASEPLVASPVAMDFDADGRLFVAEMRDYSEQDKERLGRIRLLEDTDNNGRFERATIFSDDLSWPTAVACAGGGVFVGAAPHVYFLRDDDGDGRADTKRIVFTGFKRDNVQGLLNSFQWGLDNRLHGVTSTAGGEIQSGEGAAAGPKPLSLRGRDFSIDTRTMTIRAESGGGQHGMSFDEWGRKFVSSNSDHIQLVLAEDRYLARNPYLAAPPPRVSIAADGPQAEVFRISPVEPWRILRTRLRVAGAVPGPIEGGGRPAGYFTGATGVTIYRGDAWPAEFRGNAFIGDVGSNIVHRKTLSADGLSLVAKRVLDGREFLASSDTWFRPAQFANGPDGNLYVIDVYREVIEHPASLPPAIKKHLDLTSGRDRGRIYRIKPRGFTPPPRVRLSKATLDQLVSSLEHTNGWHRQTASRLIYERNDKAATPLLVSLAQNSRSPLGRMHAIRALDGLDSLPEQTLLAGLADRDPRVRRHAVQLAERMPGAVGASSALVSMADDDDLLVRYQLAFTLGELTFAGRLPALAAIARRDSAHLWMRLAIQSSLYEGAGIVFASLSGDAAFRRSDDGGEMLASLALQIGLQNRTEDIHLLTRALDSIASVKEDQDVSETIALALVRGAKNSGANNDASLVRHPVVAAAAAKAVSRAKDVASDPSRGIASRLRAIDTLTLTPFSESRGSFTALLAADQPQEVQRGAVAALSRLRDGQAAELLIEHWPGFTPRLRDMAIEGLFANRDSMERFVTAVEDGKIDRRDVDPSRVSQLLRHGNAKIRRRAELLFGAARKGERGAIVERYRAALGLAGSAEKGRVVFRAACVACHRAEGVGHELAPNLTTVQNRGAEAILLNILDPNREVNPQFVNYVVVTKDGRTASGIIAGESATSITLRRGEDQSETILRSQIEELASSGMSLMPEGLEKEIDQQAMADLLAYLTTLQ
jgi:putative membrane-bound dehydrogenase-like protein